MNGWVDELFAAMARQEGAFDKHPTIPQLCNNPLDLRFAHQIGARRPGNAPPPPPGEPEPIAEFNTLQLGIAAGYRQLWLDIARGETLGELISGHAPPNENDTAKYIADVMGWCQTPFLKDPTTVLLQRLQLESIDG